MPWRLPWTSNGVETRASYTDALTSLLIREASGSGSPTGQAHATAAVEACAGLYARGFAVADVSPTVPALSPDVLATIARSLVLDGESLWVIDVGENGIKLLPVGDSEVRGTTPDPTEWTYRVSLYGPSGSVTRTVPSAGIVHIRASVDPARPWRGISGLRRAGLSSDLLSSLETRLGEESSSPVANLVPSPADGQAASTATLRSDLKAAKGGLVLVETMASGYGDKAGAPMQDWSVKRIGGNPPDVLRALRSDVGMDVCSALGVPPSLFAPNADGTAQRESVRRWSLGSLAALGRIATQELSVKLDLEDLHLDFGALFAHDAVGRSQAFARMVQGGMPVDKAASLAGLLTVEGE